ncbi:hypothetical protein TruAng_006641 [Truncatella angustata]|nr:hypothetical protein TruAng_006641 [Truncatella angustata]
MCMDNTNDTSSTRLAGYLTRWETLAARDIQANTLFVSAVAGLLLLKFLSAIKQHYSGVKAEAVGYKSSFEPGWLVRLRFVRGSTPIIREGVLRNDGDILVISNKHLNQLRNLPDEHISAIKAHIKNLLGRFSTTTIMLESDLPTRVLQQKLTPSLASAIHLLQTELEYAAQVEIPACEGKDAQTLFWLTRVIAKRLARVFVGPDLCRNREWLHTSIHYTENVFMTVMTLRMFPPVVHSFLALLMPSYWRTHANLRSAKRLISPLIRQRRAAAAEQELGADVSPDLLQMMMDLANEQEGDPDKLTHRQLLLSLASIHTTTMATAHALYDLCAHPEYFEPLQQEINEVFLAEGSLGKAALNKLRKLDSFMKESQRVNPPSQRQAAGIDPVGVEYASHEFSGTGVNRAAPFDEDCFISTETSEILEVHGHTSREYNSVATIADLYHAVCLKDSSCHHPFLTDHECQNETGLEQRASAAHACMLGSFLLGPNDDVIGSEDAEYREHIQVNWSKDCWLEARCVIRPSSAAAVQRVMKIISRTSSKFAIRSGGHNPNRGWGSIDGDGILVDLSLLNQMHIGLDARTVRIGLGLRWIDVYKKLDGTGRTVLGGRTPDVGVGGLLLGGGIPSLSSEFGMACYLVRSYESVKSAMLLSLLKLLERGAFIALRVV